MQRHGNLVTKSHVVGDVDRKEHRHQYQIFFDRNCILPPPAVHGDHKALDGNEKELGEGEDGTAGRFILNKQFEENHIAATTYEHQ